MLLSSNNSLILMSCCRVWEDRTACSVLLLFHKLLIRTPLTALDIIFFLNAFEKILTLQRLFQSVLATFQFCWSPEAKFDHILFDEMHNVWLVGNYWWHALGVKHTEDFIPPVTRGLPLCNVLKGRESNFSLEPRENGMSKAESLSACWPVRPIAILGKWVTMQM